MFKDGTRRIQSRFRDLRSDKRTGLITFITAGDPSVADTPVLMHALVQGGADILELGVPFSDPMADGPVIQRASERALSSGVTLEDVFSCVRIFRESDIDTPVVLMGYLNPFEHLGARVFSERAASAGVDGVLIVDLPPEEAADFHAALNKANLDQIFLIAPNSQPERIRRICEFASGFVYFVGVKGVTGEKAIDVDAISGRISETCAITTLPVGIGFGIKTPESARNAAVLADAVIVGSAVVESIEQGGADPVTLEHFVSQLRTAIDAHLTVSE